MLVNCVNPSLNSVNFAKRETVGVSVPPRTVIQTVNTAVNVPKKPGFFKGLKNLAKVMTVVGGLSTAAVACTDPADVFKPTNTPPPGATPVPTVTIKPTATTIPSIPSVAKRIYEMGRVLFPPIEQILNPSKAATDFNTLSYVADGDYRLSYTPTSSETLKKLDTDKLMHIDYTSNDLLTGANHNYPSTVTELDDGSLEFDFGHPLYKAQYEIGSDKVIRKTIRKADGIVSSSSLLKYDGAGNVLVRNLADTETLETYTDFALETISRVAKKAFKSVADRVAQANLGRSAFRAFM